MQTHPLFRWFLALFTSSISKQSPKSEKKHLSVPFDIQSHIALHFASTPLAPGHVVITSRRNVARWEHLEECEQEEFWSATQTIQKKFEQYYQCSDYLLLLQQQPDFFELHVIPTKKNLATILIEHFEGVPNKNTYITQLKQRIEHIYPCKDTCPFCLKKTLDTQSYLQGKHFSVLQDRSPINPAHGLIIPRRHVEHITDIKQPELQELGNLVSILSSKYLDRLNIPSWIMIQKNGRNAGPSIDHIHFHMVPTNQADMYHVLLQEVTKVDSEFLTTERIIEYRNTMKKFTHCAHFPPKK